MTAMIRPRRTVQQLKPYLPPPGGRRGKLRLDFNENTKGCSPAVLETLKRLTAEDIAVYPEYDELRSELARACGLEPDNLLLTNGSDEGLRYIFDAYLGRGEEIVVPVPTFAMITIYAGLREAKIVEVPYKRDFSFPVQRVLRSIGSKTRIVMLVNPNNPTGTEIKPTDVERIIRKARNALVVVDEAYHQYLGHTAIRLLKKYSNVLVIQTLSKAYGLAGLRVGYVAGSKEMIASLSKVVSPYSVNSVAVACARSALADSRYVTRYVKEVKESKRFLRAELKKLGLRVVPSAANFFLVDFGNRAGFVDAALRKEGILVRDRSSVPRLKGFVRIGVGTKKQCKMLLDSLRRILSPKALIFDMDGVLIDVSRSYRKAIKRTVEHFTGRRITYTQIQKAKEEGSANNDWVLSKRLIDRLGGHASLEQVVAFFQREYLGAENKTGLIANEKWLLSRQPLDSLASKFKLAIVTGRPRYEADLALKIWGVSDRFLTVVAMEDADGRMKPDPHPLQRAMKQLHADTCVYVGDTIDDIQAAVAAGCIPIGVTPAGLGKNARKDLLTRQGAKKVLHSVNELPKALGAIRF
jgi:histidinol-phosphate aminotransferase